MQYIKASYGILESYLAISSQFWGDPLEELIAAKNEMELQKKDKKAR